MIQVHPIPVVLYAGQALASLTLYSSTIQQKRNMIVRREQPRLTNWGCPFPLLPSLRPSLPLSLPLIPFLPPFIHLLSFFSFLRAPPLEASKRVRVWAPPVGPAEPGRQTVSVHSEVKNTPRDEWGQRCWRTLHRKTPFTSHKVDQKFGVSDTPTCRIYGVT